MPDNLPSSNGRWRSYLATAVLIVLPDQAVKQVVMVTMPHGSSIAIAPFFNFVHVWNTTPAFASGSR